MVYVYLIGSAFYAVIWFVMFYLKKELRRPMLVSSIIGAPLGLFEVFFAEYWVPVFDVIPIYHHLYLDDLIFCFFNAGVIVGMIYLIKPKVSRISPWVYLGISASVIFYLLDPLEMTFMNYVLLSLAIGVVIVTLAVKKEDRIALLKVTFINEIIYMVMFAALWFTIPSLSGSYKFENFWGFNIFTIPVEEYLWIAGYAYTWLPIYELVRPWVERTNRKVSRSPSTS